MSFNNWYRRGSILEFRGIVWQSSHPDSESVVRGALEDFLRPSELCARSVSVNELQNAQNLSVSACDMSAAKSGRGRGMAVMLLVTGALHFLTPGGFDKIVPPILPLEPRFWTYLSGVAELLIALMLLAPLDRFLLRGHSLRFYGAIAALLLFIAVFPANIYMAVDWSSRPMPAPLFAYARLPLQFGLFYWAIALARAFRQSAPQVSRFKAV